MTEQAAGEPGTAGVSGRPDLDRLLNPRTVAFVGITEESRWSRWPDSFYQAVEAVVVAGCRAAGAVVLWVSRLLLLLP